MKQRAKLCVRSVLAITADTCHVAAELLGAASRALR